MKVFRNVIAVLLGIVVGGFANMGIISISDKVIPLPEGIDPSSMESLAASMHLFQAQNFLMPFLAHALGTFSGAWLTVLVAASRKSMLAMIVGIFFLIGGVINVFMLPAPFWFSFLDLFLAYLPMAFLASKMVKR
ncbi:MAG: hypothetical protein JXR60_05350 [Bacteroidales bacterium]|nr:hypothetical protein [Bacteroidales bacterium]